MRKMFTKWLGAARAVRHRRVTLQQCEEEMKRTRLLILWDKWRERYQDIQLRPLVRPFRATWTPLVDISQAESFVLQKQTNLVFYAFGIWHSKTRVSRGLSDGYQPSGALMNTHASSSPFPPYALMLLT
jgi:protein SFI1